MLDILEILMIEPEEFLEKANVVAGNRTDEFINVDDIDSTTEEKIHDFQQQVQLTLDYLESQNTR